MFKLFSYSYDTATMQQYDRIGVALADTMEEIAEFAVQFLKIPIQQGCKTVVVVFDDVFQLLGHTELNHGFIPVKKYTREHFAMATAVYNLEKPKKKYKDEVEAFFSV